LFIKYQNIILIRKPNTYSIGLTSKHILGSIVQARRPFYELVRQEHADQGRSGIRCEQKGCMIKMVKYHNLNLSAEIHVFYLHIYTWVICSLRYFWLNLEIFFVCSSLVLDVLLLFFRWKLLKSSNLLLLHLCVLFSNFLCFGASSIVTFFSLIPLPVCSTYFNRKGLSLLESFWCAKSSFIFFVCFIWVARKDLMAVCVKSFWLKMH